MRGGRWFNIRGEDQGLELDVEDVNFMGLGLDKWTTNQTAGSDPSQLA